ncbi:collagen alpha-1(XII) chain-like [Mya arenaria]|uniref:collagen alpha-1(XII) chain-like n=1 Tax=Mya arenaria TaxID=6604 RepID=UPI0022E44F72|nr:collagen alpha-1(XII) chain-like [Mya arenaria]
MYVFGFLLLVCLAEKQVNCNIQCLDCSDRSSPDVCRYATTCNEHEKCFVSQYVTSGGDLLYSMGCRSAETCKAGEAVSKRRQVGQDVIVCTECCEGDFCNVQGCGSSIKKLGDRGPFCFSCGVQNAPDSCRDLTQCSEGQVCALIEPQLRPGHYMSKCVAPDTCPVLNMLKSELGCPMCCYEDFCNNKCVPRNGSHTTTHTQAQVTSSATSIVPSPSTENFPSPRTEMLLSLSTERYSNADTTHPSLALQSSAPTYTQPTALHTASVVCSKGPRDVIFVLDGSGSEGGANYQKQLTFVQNVVQRFNVGFNQTRVSVVPFSTNVTNGFLLNQCHDNSAMCTLNLIQGIPYPNGESNTHIALQYVKDHVLTAAGGGDRSVPKVIILLTDGQSNNHTASVLTAAQLKANSLVKIITVGIGDNVYDAELRNISSDANHSFAVADFDALKSLDDVILHKTCDACNTKADICFVLDSSGSVDSLNFLKQLQFTNMVVSGFPLGKDTGAQFCVVTFSTNANLEIALGAQTDTNALKNDVLRITYRPGESMAEKGISLGTFELSDGNSPRPDARKILVIVMDGHSNDPGRTTNAAAAAHRHGIETFLIGVGPDMKHSELTHIPSGQDHVFTVSTFNDLVSVQENVKNIMFCQ